MKNMIEMIVDSHIHLGKNTEHIGYYGTSPSQLSAEEMLKVMEKNNVNRSIAMAMGRGKNLDYKEDNQYISKIIKDYPDKFSGFARINPWSKQAVMDLERAILKMGFRGLKLHPEVDSFRPTDEMVFPLIEKSKELCIPVIIHSHRPGKSQPALIGDLAYNYPEVTFIMAHMGGNLYLDAFFVAKVCSNVILECSAQPWIHRIARGIIDKIGSKRLIWGSDYPFHFQKVEKLRIECVLLKVKEFNRVMAENILEILNK
jgi:predicted TIM-barrel fold metal-dependent hydrolase